MALQYLKIPLSLKDHFTLPFQGTLCLTFPRFAVCIKKYPGRSDLPLEVVSKPHQRQTAVCERVRLLAGLGVGRYDDVQAPVKKTQKKNR